MREASRKIYGTILIKALWIIMPIIFLITACADKNSVVLPVIEDYDNETEIQEKINLRVGFASDSYENMYLDAIQPILAKKGYTVETYIYGDYVQPNLALANDEIDLNMFQHLKFLNNFKFEYDLDLSAITEIPTAPMGIYSKKYASLDDLNDSATIAIPNDATNLSRALLMLEAAGIVELDMYVDKSKATINDIVNNPKNLQFTFLEASQLAESLNSHDFSVINGGFALSAGLKLSDTLYREILGENYVNVIVVRTDDLNKQFVQDILDAVRSDEFIDIITDVNRKYNGFQLPR